MAKSQAKNSGKIPQNEILWEQYFNKDGMLMFVMTSDRLAETYMLYHHDSGLFSRIGAGKSPLDLEKKYSINEIILGKLEYKAPA